MKNQKISLLACLIFISFLIPNPLLSQYIQFHKTFSGEQLPIYPYVMDDIGIGIEATSDGGFIIIGTHDKANNGHTYPSGKIIKTNNFGDTIWTRTIGDTLQHFQLWDVKETSDSCFVACGTSSQRACLLKINPFGELLWLKRYSFGYSTDAREVIEMEDGGFAIIGKASRLSHPLFQTDVALIRTNSSGDTLWTKLYNHSRFESGFSIQSSSENGFLVGGYTLYHPDSVYAYKYGILMKLDSLGNNIWSKIYGGGLDHEVMIESVVLLENDTIMFSAEYNEIYQLIGKISPEGDSLWFRTYETEGSNYIHDLLQTPDGNFIACSDFVLKFDTHGNSIWSRDFGKQNMDFISSVSNTQDGGFAFTGSSSYRQSLEHIDISFIKTNDMGLSGCQQDTISLYTIIPQINVFNIGMSISSGASVFNDTIKYEYRETRPYTHCFSVGIEDRIIPRTGLWVFPNPTSSDVHLEFADNKFIGERIFVSIVDLQGRFIKSSTFDNFQASYSLNVNDLDAGTYIILAHSEKMLIGTSKLYIIR